jgi:cytoskeletal protein CcmA (bactofilin family)
MWSFGNNQPEIMTGQEGFTFLARGVVFRGTISLEGNVRIDGRIEGEIHSVGTLTIGEHAVITGDIKAETLTTSGKITGTIIVTKKITILKPGVLIGDILTPAISIETGAVFHGLSDMSATIQGEDQPASSGKVHELAAYRKELRAQNF